MLYERWRALASERGDKLALQEPGAGRRWTFRELFAAGEAKPTAPTPFVHPQGQGAAFILDVLTAWRDHRAACPLEPGQAPPDFLPPPFCAHLKSTSATGGPPRWVAFTAGQLAADADNIVATMGLREEWPNLGVISLAHSYGFSNLVTPLLLHGIPLILAAAPLPETIRRASENAGVLTLAAVPAMWRAWHEAAAIPRNVRLAISAGATLPLNLEQAVFASHGLKIHNFLGSTECGGMVYDAEEIPRTDGSCAGTPLRNVKLSRNDDGCLTVTSGAVAESYWPPPSDLLGGGIFQTSDLAELRDGKVFLTGRRGDVIHVAGRKISPEIIELTLLKHPRVRACLVFGAPSRDAERTENIVASVAGNASEAELRAFLLEQLPAWQVPRIWEFVPALPVNGRGKISRAEYRRHWVTRTNR